MKIPVYFAALWLVSQTQLLANDPGSNLAPTERGASGASIFSVTNVTMLTGFVSALALIAWIISRFRGRSSGAGKHDPRSLLGELCRAHGLSRRAERLLRRAAKILAVAHPGRLFLEPQLLASAAAHPDLRASKISLDLLHERLFDAPESS